MSTSPALKLLIYTDLDGTLLDHHDYGFEPARATIKLLNKRGITWIFNTSKTLAELITLRETLDNLHPMIVENGGGIVIPLDYPLIDAPFDTVKNGFQLKAVGAKREDILRVLKPLHNKYTFTGFNDMTAAELSDVTGLSKTQTEQALIREFSEPILWQDSAKKLEHFTQIIAGHSLQLLRGGRFIHVIGNSNKGLAMNWLTALYRVARPELKTVALGDGENDVAMLEQADIPIIIRSPAHSPPTVTCGNTVLTESCGPRGWSEGLQMLLKEFEH